MDQTSNSSQIPFNFNPNLNFNNPFNNINNSTYNQNPMMMQNQMMGNNMQNQMMMQNMQNQMMMNQLKVMQQLNNNNNQQNNQNISQSASSNAGDNDSPQGLNVVFRVSGPGGQGKPPLNIQCMPHEKVSELIKRYRTKSGDKDPTKKFIFNAKNLNQDLTVGEAGISNNGNIFVVTTQGVKGAYFIN